MYILIAILSGLTNVVSRSVNFVLSEKIGLYQSTFFNYIFGLAGSIIILLVSKETFQLNTAYDNDWFIYIGGLIGVIVVTLSSYLSSKISSFYLTLLLFIGQLFTGIILDSISSGKISLTQVIGGTFVIVGLSYNLYLDKKKEKDTLEVLN